MSLPGDAVVLNCAGCGKVLLAQVPQNRRLAERGDAPPFVAGRIKDRPFCSPCLGQSNASWEATRGRTEGQRRGLGRTNT